MKKMLILTLLFLCSVIVVGSNGQLYVNATSEENIDYIMEHFNSRYRMENLTPDLDFDGVSGASMSYPGMIGLEDANLIQPGLTNTSEIEYHNNLNEITVPGYDMTLEWSDLQWSGDISIMNPQYLDEYFIYYGYEETHNSTPTKSFIGFHQWCKNNDLSYSAVCQFEDGNSISDNYLIGTNLNFNTPYFSAYKYIVERDDLSKFTIEDGGYDYSLKDKINRADTDELYNDMESHAPLDVYSSSHSGRNVIVINKPSSFRFVTTNFKWLDNVNWKANTSYTMEFDYYHTTGTVNAYVYFLYTDGTTDRGDSYTIGSWDTVSVVSDANKTVDAIVFSYGSDNPTYIDFNAFNISEGTTGMGEYYDWLDGEKYSTFGKWYDPVVMNLTKYYGDNSPSVNDMALMFDSSTDILGSYSQGTGNYALEHYGNKDAFYPVESVNNGDILYINYDRENHSTGYTPYYINGVGGVQSGNYSGLITSDVDEFYLIMTKNGTYDHSLIDDVFTLNLTQIFGSGLEPTVEQMDNFFADVGWFDSLANHIWDLSILEEDFTTGLGSLDEDDYYWERSVYGRNGSNIKDMKIDFLCEPDSDGSEDSYLYYEFDGFVKNIPLPCEDYEFRDYIPLDNDDLQYIKKILFDRNFENTRQMGFKVYNSSSDVTYTHGIGFEFYSNQEFKIQSVMLHTGNIDDWQSLFGTYEYLYLFDHTLNPFVKLKTIRGGGYSDNWAENTSYVYNLPDQYKEVWGLRYETTFDFYADSGQTDAVYSFTEFNAFATSEFFKPPVSDVEFFDDDNILLDKPEYDSCSSTDVFCHLKNAVVWIVVDFPPIAIIYTGISSMLNLFYGILTSMLGIFGVAIINNEIVQTYTGVISYTVGACVILIIYEFIKKVGGVIK